MVTVLLVEDDPEYASAIADWLSHHDVVIATSGQDALENFDESIDIALLDRRLPDIQGEEVLAEIRSTEIDCRVAMVTAVEPDIDVAKMGFDEYVVKPVTKDEIQSLVDRLVKLAEYDDQIRRLYQLTSRRITLEASKSAEDLESHREYTELVDEFERVRDEVDETIQEILAEDPKLLIQ